MLQEGFLKVGDIHEIYYMTFGNAEGKPVIVLHGGPGYGSYPWLTQYFDPDKFLIVLHDQRGAGRSRPAGELRENTTQDLVGDIERLRDHLDIKGIPVTIINGRYDVICPPMAAWRLHQHIPGSKLVIVEKAGHSETEPGTTAALLAAVREFE